MATFKVYPPGKPTKHKIKNYTARAKAISAARALSRRTRGAFVDVVRNGITIAGCSNGICYAGKTDKII